MGKKQEGVKMEELSAKDRAAHALANKKIAEQKRPVDNLMLTFWAQQHRLWLLRSLAEEGKKKCSK